MTADDLRALSRVARIAGDPVHLLPDEVDAIADLIDAADDAVTYAPNGDPNCAHSAGDGVSGLCVHCGFNPALDRLSDALAALDQETPI